MAPEEVVGFDERVEAGGGGELLAPGEGLLPGAVLRGLAAGSVVCPAPEETADGVVCSGEAGRAE